MCRLPAYTVGMSLTIPPAVDLWKWCQYRPQPNKKLDFKVTSRASVLRASSNTRGSPVIASDDEDYGLLFGEALFFFTVHLPAELSIGSSDTSDDERGTRVHQLAYIRDLALMLVAVILVYWGVLAQVGQGV